MTKLANHEDDFQYAGHFGRPYLSGRNDEPPVSQRLLLAQPSVQDKERLAALARDDPN